MDQKYGADMGSNFLLHAKSGILKYFIWCTRNYIYMIPYYMGTLHLKIISQFTAIWFKMWYLVWNTLYEELKKAAQKKNYFYMK